MGALLLPPESTLRPRPAADCTCTTGVSPSAGSTALVDYAERAYASACSTAETGWWYADEAIHLDSTFHLAGYRHAVGSLTMWYRGW